jgi:hypothetical protein
MRLGCLLLFAMGCSAGAAPTTAYEIGPLSSEEQLYIELINRARANPAAEGTRLAALGTSDQDVRRNYNFYAVDLAMMQSEMAALPAAPPLAPNKMLRQAALAHSQDMATTGKQDHTGSDGSRVRQRVQREGYDFTHIAENIYTSGSSTEHGHAGFVVDWGIGRTGGMQDGRGHRLSIHSLQAREVGIGVANTNKPNVGPQVVTQLFGATAAGKPFVTGVAYLDLDGDGCYSVGEGIDGVIVSVSGSTFHARTGEAGGFAIPLAGDGGYELRFRAPGMASAVNSLNVVGGANVKIDLRRPYTPTVSGPDRPIVGRGSVYRIAPVAGTTRYRLQAGRMRAARKHDAEDGSSRAAITQSEGYDTVQTTVVDQGTRAFHLAHPTNTDQIVLLKTVFVPGSAARLVFRSRLGAATVGQSAMVEVFSEGRWQEVFRQVGLGENSWGEQAFREINVDLAGFINREISIRFRYIADPASRYYQLADQGIGWYFDDIRLPGVREVHADRAIETGLARKVSFRPDRGGAWWLRAQAKVSGKFLRTGPGRIVQAVAP